MSTTRYYIDLTVELRGLNTTSDTFTVTLTAPAVGESGEVSVPYAYSDLEDALHDLERKYLDQASLIALGQQLADRLLPGGQIRALFVEAYKKAGQAGGVRLRLLIREPELAQLPWEYAYLKIHSGEDDTRHFLALNPQLSIVRHPALDAPHPSLAPTNPGPLRLVAAMANVQAPGYPKLKLEREKKIVEQALSATADIDLKWDAFLEDATVDDLKLALQQKPDLFHFAGHGIFAGKAKASSGTRSLTWDESASELTTQHGAIILAADKATRAPRPFPANQLAAELQKAGVRLAVLGACHSGRQDGLNAWTGIAPALIERGIPAVVAMQYEVIDDAAIAFNKMFYTALANGLSVDEAVSEGRLAMWANDQRREAEWGVPVLYMRSADGLIFPERSADPAREAEQDGSRLRINQFIEALYGQATGAEIKKMLGGYVEIVQKAKTVNAGAHLIGATIETMDGGEVEVKQNIGTATGNVTGAKIDFFGSGSIGTKKTDIK